LARGGAASLMWAQLSSRCVHAGMRRSIELKPTLGVPTPSTLVGFLPWFLSGPPGIQQSSSARSCTARRRGKGRRIRLRARWYWEGKNGRGACSRWRAGRRLQRPKEKKRKEKTTLAVTATVSDSTAGISLEEAPRRPNYYLLFFAFLTQWHEPLEGCGHAPRGHQLSWLLTCPHDSMQATFSHGSRGPHKHRPTPAAAAQLQLARLASSTHHTPLPLLLLLRL